MQAIEHFHLNYSFMKRLLLTTLASWLLLLVAPGAGLAQQASASLQCCTEAPICAGETASLLVVLEGKAPYSFQYSDGISTQTVRTSETSYELKVAPSLTRSYKLISMQDASGIGQACGSATVAVNQCTPPKSGKDCSDNCFDSKVVEQKTSGSCTTYTLQVNNDGSCQSALSHFSISVPCGQIKEASNSRGWPMEIGTTDPTTGITGIKVDNIKGFGEDGKAGSFTVTYTICSTSCGGGDPLCGFLVAYKAGTCVNYGTAQPPYVPMSGSLAASDLKCFGDTNGSIQLSLQGGKAPYTYQWSNGATTANPNSLAAGTYSLIITDAANKQLALSTTIGQPQALLLQANSKDASCGASNGSIDLTVSGGTAPFTYSWSKGANVQDLDQLPAGIYSVLVKDANDCSATAEYTIKSSGAVQLSLNTSGGGCGAATISALVNGGTAPYQYLWNTGAQTSTLTSAEAGTYTLQVTDAAGCTATASTTISGSGQPVEIAYEYSSPSCSGGNDGWIDAIVSGGTGSYTYSWSNGASSEDLENLSSGSYSLTVTDASGCTATIHISVPQTPAIGITVLETIQPDCHGNLGGLTISAYNGTAPYTYTWAHGATGESLEGLESGYYTVTVTDVTGCKVSRSFQIKEPNSPQVQINGGSCGDNTLTAVVSGGEGPYSYTWSNGASSGSITGESGQYYTVLVTDQNGCTAEADIQLDEIGSALSLSTVSTSPNCNGGTDGSIDLTVSGGTGTYTIVWSNGSYTEDLSNIGAGTYAVTVTDESGCTKTASVTIANPAAITVLATETIHANCHGLGGITVDAQNGTAPYTYSWAHGATGNSLDALEAGQYTVSVTDAKGCTTQKTFTIRDEQAPAVRIATLGNCSSYQLSAIVNGTTGPYTYLWSSGQQGASILPTVSGSYSVTVTDANGCTATAYTDLSLGESALSLSAHVQPVSCAGSKDGAASIQVSGGTAPYTYDWSNGLSSASSSSLSAGVYSVRVTDARGCYDVVAFQIKHAAPMVVSLLGSTASSCGLENGSLTIRASGGTAPYTYKWNTGATSENLSGVAAGSYTVAVIDAIGCATEATFAVEASTTENNVIASIDNCQDTIIAKGATATLNVSFGGLAPYTFTYTDGQTEYTVTTSENPYNLVVQPGQTTTYTLLSVASGCQTGNAFGAATVTVVTPKLPVCTDGCFSTDLISTVIGNGCTTYTLQVNAGSDCRYDLSHFEVALPCGTVSNMNNSGGWPMSVGMDPTTGVWGIKVDNIKNFSANESFTLSYTLCNAEACADAMASCGPLVSYKAGQCVYFGKATPTSAPVAGNPSYDGVLGPGMSLKLYPNPLMANQALSVEIENLFVTTNATITISSLTGLKVHEQSQMMSPSNRVVTVSLPQLPAGSYLVSVQFNNNRYTKQLFIY